MTEERLIQPGDTPEGQNLPPTYTAGNLPPGEPVEAVKKGRTKFYGPVSGPFACITREDTLQVDAGWQGWIALDVNGFAYPVAADVFEQTYDVVGRDLKPADGGEQGSPLTFTPDLELVEQVAPALRRQAVRIQYQAALEQTLSELAAAGLIPDNIDELEAQAVEQRPDAENADDPEATVQTGDPEGPVGDIDIVDKTDPRTPEVGDEDPTYVPIEQLQTEQLIAVMNGDFDAFEDAGQYDVPGAFGQLQAKAAGGDGRAADFVAAVEAATSDGP
jgi:hypothetical protein